jgi:hypothetical protein
MFNRAILLFTLCSRNTLSILPWNPLLNSASKRASTEKRETKKNLFVVFWLHRPRLHKGRKNKRKKGTRLKSKFIRICLKESVHREEKDQEKPIFCVLAAQTFF